MLKKTYEFGSVFAEQFGQGWAPGHWAALIQSSGRTKDVVTTLQPLLIACLAQGSIHELLSVGFCDAAAEEQASKGEARMVPTAFLGPVASDERGCGKSLDSGSEFVRSDGTRRFNRLPLETFASGVH